MLDIDDTADTVHGHQQLSLFNAHGAFLAPLDCFITGATLPSFADTSPGERTTRYRLTFCGVPKYSRVTSEPTTAWPPSRS
jgi:hypothetical protein